MRQLNTFRATEHFDRLHIEGRKRPPPSLGSPTFVWHIGIWRKSDFPPSPDTEGTGAYIDGCVNRNRLFLEELSEFIRRLQKRGQLGFNTANQEAPVKPSPIILEGMDSGGMGGQVRQFETYKEHSHTFVMWWRDADGPVGKHTPMDANDTAIDKAVRVVVQTQVYADYASVSIYLDGAKRYSGKQIHAINEGDLGHRRERFAKHLDLIRKNAYDEIKTGQIDYPNTRDDRNKIRNNSELKEAVEYLFEGIWQEFESDFGFQLAKLGEETFKNGVVFLNHRGLLMSVKGIRTQEDARRDQVIEELIKQNDIERIRYDHEETQQPWVPSSRGSSSTIGPVDKFDGEVNEPEIVLKSLWPSLCHMEPQAGNVDWVGCGILENRAIFASSLGAKPIDELALDTRSKGGTKVASTTKFIVLSKGEPHRKQIGRFVDRILSLETMRVFALKNIGSIQNANLYLEAVIKHLDDVRRKWSSSRDDLERTEGKWKEFSGHLPSTAEHVARGKADGLRKNREQYYSKLGDLNAQVETQLIHIGAELERMGPGGSGHLAHNIGRASFLIDRFRHMLETLEIENLNGWINYRQFSDRSLGPTFDMIKATGSRLNAAQDRLKSLTDIVQVSALIVQSAATRQNTSQLEEIAVSFSKMRKILTWATRYQWLAIIVALFIAGFGFGRIWNMMQSVLGYLFV